MNGPSSIGRHAKLPTYATPRTTWSTRRSISTSLSRGNPSSTSSTSFCPARSSPHSSYWPTSCPLKVSVGQGCQSFSRSLVLSISFYLSVSYVSLVHLYFLIFPSWSYFSFFLCYCSFIVLSFFLLSIICFFFSTLHSFRSVYFH